MSCIVCGSLINQGLYRPKSYCSDNCRNYMKYKNALERCILSLNPTLNAKKIIKGDMFRLSNIVSNGTILSEIKSND